MDDGPVGPVPELSTARLVLRAFRERDLDAYAAMCADPQVMRFIGAGVTVDRSTAWRQMAMFVGEWSLHGFGMWAVVSRRDGALLGRAGFLNPPGWPAPELGWLLARDAWGHGYAYEAACAARDYGRRQPGLRAPISMIRPENLRSIALATRMGAALESEAGLMGARVLVYRHPD